MTKRRTFLLVLLAGLLGVAALGAATGVEILAALSGLAFLVVVLVWLGALLLRRLLWRVGRRLTFSYFLVGVLPIFMLLALGVAGTYIVASALVGHLFRDALMTVQTEVAQSVEAFHDVHARLSADRGGRPAARIGPLPLMTENVALAYYRDGRKVLGGPWAPRSWPQALAGGEPEPSRVDQLHYVLVEQRLSVAVLRGSSELGTLGVFARDLETVLRERTGLWVQIDPWDEESHVTVTGPFGETKIGTPRQGFDEEARARFFQPETGELMERPLLAWAEPLVGSPPIVLPSGEEGSLVGALLSATPAGVYRHVVSSAAQIDVAAWTLFLVLAFLLFDVYAAAALMAVVMIVGLSRAVNRLSRATTHVQEGDFSHRIPVRRKDQLGDLQRSFNEMTASLEEAVATAAEKETIEKELQIARELQRSLLPSSLTATEAVEFASYFEPSAAIGGDYFDLLKLPDGRLAVIVADVSGHGLSAGLRMAMLKAALVMLVEQQLPSQRIFSRLNRMIRAESTPRAGRPLVTATLARFDPASGALDLTNAGHIPTYRLRTGEVDEIILPSPPLGGIGEDYAEVVVELEPGDVVVWLSDGLIEARDASEDSFGYERMLAALEGSDGTAASVRDRVLSAVADHCGPEPPADDRTLVVMRYLSRRVEDAIPASPSSPTEGTG